MRRSLVALLLLCFLQWMPLSGYAGNTRGGQKEDTARLDTVLQPYDRPDAPGGSVIVIKEGRVVYKKAFGLADCEAKIPNTTKTNFRLASVTKQFTAMAILILMERGKLKLEDRLSQFFPDFPAYGRDITVRQLLSHTSGLPDYASLIPEGQKEQLRDKDVLRLLVQQKSGEFTPGSKFEYSNSGYAMLALIVEKVSGKSFAQFLKDNIFQTLGMSDTVAYEEGVSTVKNRAYGYSPADNRFQRTDQSLTSAVQGDGGIYSSVEDMYRWDQALNTNKLVRAETLKMAFMPGKEAGISASNYGFGWFIDNVQGFRKVWHGGGTIGFRNELARYPDQKFTVLVLMNRNDGTPNQIANKIARIYFPNLATPQPPIAKVAPAVLETYTGRYHFQGKNSTVLTRDGRLIWTIDGEKPIELLPATEDTFFYADLDINPEGNWRITFVKDAQGQPKELVFKVDGKAVLQAPYQGR